MSPCSFAINMHTTIKSKDIQYCVNLVSVISCVEHQWECIQSTFTRIHHTSARRSQILINFFLRLSSFQLLTGHSVTTCIDCNCSKEFDMSSQVNTVLSSTSNSVTRSQPDTYCCCDEGESDRIIACNNLSCTIEWFRFECVSLSRKPRGRWFCSDSCRNACQ